MSHSIVLTIILIIPAIFAQQPPSELLQSRGLTTLCVTPNNDTGICVNIKKCTKFLNSVETNRDFINSSWCGPKTQDQKQLKICCGKHTNYIKPDKPGINRPQNERVKINPFPETCGNQTFMFISRVMGGTESALGEYPWLARLKHRRRSGLETFGCVGFLVSEKFVITAAHCVRSKNLEPLGPLYQVQLGEHDSERDPDCVFLGKKKICSDSPQLLRTAKPIVHPDYLENSIEHYHDIAVIPLKEAACFTRYVYPICLAEKHFEETEYWISGWGKTETRRSSPTKLKVLLQKSDRGQCIENYARVEVNILKSQMCAGGEAGRDSCAGDSGGPLMTRNGLQPWHAVGIVSFGFGCGLEGWPGIYTDIPHYYPWIKKVMNRYLRKHDGNQSVRK